MMMMMMKKKKKMGEFEEFARKEKTMPSKHK